MLRWLAVCCTGLMFFIGGHGAQAVDHPDLSGTWCLDLKTPGANSMDALLRAQGLSWAERKAAQTMPMLQTISQKNDVLTIRIQSLIRNHSETVFLDGSSQIRDVERLGKVETHSSWSKDGTSAVTIVNFNMPDGRKAKWTSRRYLSEDQMKMIVDHLLSISDGQKITGKRVFIRQ